MTTLDELRIAAHEAGLIIEPDIRPKDEGGGPSLGWGWWHPKHRPWHYAPQGRRRWSEREAIEDGLRDLVVIESQRKPTRTPQEDAKMAKKKRKAKVKKVTTVSLARLGKALAEVSKLKAENAAKDEAISKLVAQKRVDPRPGFEWKMVPIKTDGTAPSGTPTA